jgi:glycosyltransferase involved in cell wall biosynthesis
MAPYALAARAATKPGQARPRLVLDQHNAVHLIPARLAAAAGNPVMRLGWQREARRMALYEATICQAFDRVVTVTEADRQALHSLYPVGPRPPITVIPICIDPAAIRRQPRPKDSPGLLFLGGMHWPPNADGAHWFAMTILPAVLAQQPRAHFLAVGRQPPKSLLRPAARGVEAPGYVDDPEPYWDRSQAFVVPLRAGGGMRVKILEAWARGVPVVATTVGAEGIAYRAGENILIADTPQTFAECVLSILRDPALAAQLALGGRAAVEQNYDWRQTYTAWESVYAAQ